MEKMLTIHLAQGVDVIGIDRHNIPVRMGVKILDRQALHMFEKFDPEPLHGPLRDKGHRPRLKIGGTNADHIKTGDPGHCMQQRRKIRSLLPRLYLLYHRSDVAVDQCPGEHSSLNIRKNSHHYTDCHQRDLDPVKAEYIGKNPAKELSGVFHLWPGSSPHSPRAVSDLLNLFCHFIPFTLKNASKIFNI